MVDFGGGRLHSLGTRPLRPQDRPESLGLEPECCEGGGLWAGWAPQPFPVAAAGRGGGGRLSLGELIWRSDFPPQPAPPWAGLWARRWPRQGSQGGASLSGRKHWAQATSSSSWSQQLPWAGKHSAARLLLRPLQAPPAGLRPLLRPPADPGGRLRPAVVASPGVLPGHPGLPAPQPPLDHLLPFWAPVPWSQSRAGKDSRNRTKGPWLPETPGSLCAAPVPRSVGHPRAVCCLPPKHTGAQMLIPSLPLPGQHPPRAAWLQEAQEMSWASFPICFPRNPSSPHHPHPCACATSPCPRLRTRIQQTGPWEGALPKPCHAVVLGC